jgi:threonine dehydratase
VVEVSEEDIEEAWRELLDTTKLLTEPAAAVTLAALRAGLVTTGGSGTTTILVLSGGNADPSALAALLARADGPAGAAPAGPSGG